MTNASQVSQQVSVAVFNRPAGFEPIVECIKWRRASVHRCYVAKGKMLDRCSSVRWERYAFSKPIGSA